MRHIVMFSGGVGSWAAASRVIEQHGRDGVTLLFADTLAEDDDLYRFIDEAAGKLGVPLVKVQDGRTPWQVFRDVRHIGNTRIAPCSHLLKQAPCRRWLEENTVPSSTAIYVGIDWSEEHRLAAVVRHWQPYAEIVDAPLCQPPYVDKSQVLQALSATGIRPPRLYEMGFPHNNCGGACVKAGHAQWRLLLRTNPARYAQEEARECELRGLLGDVAILRDRRGGRTRPLPLSVLRERTPVASGEDDEWGGCGCFVDVG